MDERSPVIRSLREQVLDPNKRPAAGESALAPGRRGVGEWHRSVLDASDGDGEGGSGDPAVAGAGVELEWVARLEPPGPDGAVVGHVTLQGVRGLPPTTAGNGYAALLTVGSGASAVAGTTPVLTMLRLGAEPALDSTEVIDGSYSPRGRWEAVGACMRSASRIGGAGHDGAVRWGEAFTFLWPKSGGAAAGDGDFEIAVELWQVAGLCNPQSVCPVIHPRSSRGDGACRDMVVACAPNGSSSEQGCLKMVKMGSSMEATSTGCTVQTFVPAGVLREPRQMCPDPAQPGQWLVVDGATKTM